MNDTVTDGQHRNAGWLTDLRLMPHAGPAAPYRRIMTGDQDADRPVDEERAAEHELVAGLLSAIEAHGGQLDQRAIDEALGVSRSKADASD